MLSSYKHINKITKEIFTGETKESWSDGPLRTIEYKRLTVI